MNKQRTFFIIIPHHCERCLTVPGTRDRHTDKVVWPPFVNIWTRSPNMCVSWGRHLRNTCCAAGLAFHRLVLFSSLYCLCVLLWLLLLCVWSWKKHKNMPDAIGGVCSIWLRKETQNGYAHDYVSLSLIVVSLFHLIFTIHLPESDERSNNSVTVRAICPRAETICRTTRAIHLKWERTQHIVAMWPRFRRPKHIVAPELLLLVLVLTVEYGCFVSLAIWLASIVLQYVNCHPSLWLRHICVTNRLWLQPAQQLSLDKCCATANQHSACVGNQIKPFSSQSFNTERREWTK